MVLDLTLTKVHNGYKNWHQVKRLKSNLKQYVIKKLASSEKVQIQIEAIWSNIWHERVSWCLVQIHSLFHVLGELPDMFTLVAGRSRRWRISSRVTEVREKYAETVHTEVW